MIKSTDTVEDIIKEYPELNIYLIKKGIRCIVCGEPVWATLGELIEWKGMDVDRVMAEINDRFCEK